MADIVAVVMAAGKGSRMGAEEAKVLIEVGGRPMIHYVLDALVEAGVDESIVVVGYQADRVRQELSTRAEVRFVEQTEQLGTGHAVMVCREALADHDGAVVVVAGDSPMLQSESLATLLDEFHRDRPACILGTLHKPDPTGLGRIVRDETGKFVGIVEQRDATPEQHEITEVNMSTYVFDRSNLFVALDAIRNDNEQREYYLTDCPGILLRGGKDVRALPALKPIEALSINTFEELAAVEAALESRSST